MQDTSLPAGVFVWLVENNNDEDVEVSIMFTFENGDGTVSDTGGHFNEPFSCKGVYSEVKNMTEKAATWTSDVTGVLLHHIHQTAPYTLAIAASSRHKVYVQFAPFINFKK